MAETGFLEQKRIRPGSAAAVILIHGTVIGAVLLAKGESIIRHVYTPIELIDVRDPPPPPPPPPPTDDPVVQQQRSVIDQPPPLNDIRPPTPPVTGDPPDHPPDLGSTVGGDDTYHPPQQPPVDPPRQPPPAPVRVEAQMISGDLQPPYPTSEQRMEREGVVVIRVTIGANGRVIGAEKVRATSDAFYDATERHARARWRFRPATLDGRPIEGHKTLTVRFRLDG
jgi:periplasmic protein TonB